MKFKLIRFFALLNLLFFIPLSAFTESINDDKEKTTTQVTADEVIDDSERRQSPAYILKWTESLQKSDDGEYHFSTKTPIGFTSFVVGWETENKKHPAGHFTVEYRVKDETGKWSDFREGHGFVHPDETPTQRYLTNVLFPPVLDAHYAVEFKIKTPADVEITMVMIDIIDIRDTGKPGPHPDDKDRFYKDTKTCPEFPTMIPRSEWCGAYTACHNPSYTPTIIDPTHAVIHHGGMPDTYTDGYAVVRSYWNHHVNTNNWADIGYNYLFDKYGNFFQGRHNPDLPETDVRGAHAGASNSYSIGVNFLGNSDVTLPTEIQLNKNNQFLAWWFDHNDFDPTSSAWIPLQSGGSATVPRICGHRDVNIGGTTCPGDALYAELPGIRTNTKAIIDACDDSDPPVTSIIVDSEWVANNFTADFEDVDHGSGISRRFYQVLEFDGVHWKANYSRGFFGDNFESINTNPWGISSGNWHIDNNRLTQTDETIGNTNIYTPLNQTLSNRYMYQFTAKVDGSGSNKRFGLHFFSDNGSLTNRGNSYFIFFRVDGESLQFYKVEDDSWELKKTIDNISTNTGQWYDIKVIYDRITGEVLVYRDDVFLGSWTDPSPHSDNGNYISFRTGNCQLYINDLKVYRTRYPSVNISVGESDENDMRYQSVDSNTPAGKIKSIVSDNAGNLSEIAHQNMYIDWTAPVTSINADLESQWVTEDFTAEFNDVDNLSGIDRRFYNVVEFDGEWSANTQRGYFFDNFESLNANTWNSISGTWNVSDNNLQQTDGSVGNSNIYAPLKQNLSNRYLYNFQAKMSGDTHAHGRRFGFHFFADNGSLPNRGNSYFIWFRHESELLQFYKVVEDTFSLVKEVENITTNLGQWYNIKVIYDRITGEIIVYRDGTYLGKWIDSDPYQENGEYISFRTGNSELSVENITVLRTRFPEADIKVGEDDTNDIRTQSSSPESTAAKLNSIATDVAGNFSNFAELDLLVDYTPPDEVSYVFDGLDEDINETNSTTELSANWGDSQDPHSGIYSYWYAIGTEPGAYDVVDWTDNNLNTNITHDGLSLDNGSTYYFSVKAENGAGLFSDIVSSSGQTVVTGPVNLQHTLHGCPDNEVTFSWENSGTGWYIQLSLYDDFSDPYWKWVSGLTSFTGPHEFESQSDQSPLVFVDGATYYWRMFANGTFTESHSFTLYDCSCDPIAELPYNENFDNGDALCWEIENEADTTWEPITTLEIGETITVNPVSGSHFFSCHWTNTENQNEWLISPVFDFTETLPVISFYFNGSYHWSVENPNCNLDLMVKVADEEWTHLWNNQNHPEFNSNEINYEWLYTEIELMEYANMEDVQFAFQYTGYDGAAFSVDEIALTGEDINIIAGDINGDGKINVLDIVALVNYINGNIPDNFLYYNADINGDGNVGLSDLTSLIELILDGAIKDYHKRNEVVSEIPDIYLHESGLVSFDSDGTIIALQFQFIGDDINDIELESLMTTGHSLAYNSNTGLGIIYSMSNTAFPAEETDLFNISGADVLELSWGNVLASNVNHQTVRVCKHVPNVDNSSCPYYLTLNVSPDNSGTVIGEGLYPDDVTVTITANAADGFEFINWTGPDDNIISTEEVHELIMPANDYTITANFTEEVFNLTLVSNPENTGILTGDGEYLEGEEVLISAEPLEGYEFVNWTDTDNNIINENSEFEYSMPGEDITLVANFIEESTEPDFFTLTLIANPDNAGILNGAGTYEEGHLVQIIAAPFTGYEFVNWSGDIDYVDDISDSTTDVTIPGYDITVIANFDLTEYSLVTNVIPENSGNVTVSPEQDYYNYQDEITLTATPEEGYIFQNWRIDETVISSNQEFQYIMPDENVTINAHFFDSETDIYTLELFANPEEGGNVAGSGQFFEDETVRIYAITNEGYDFLNWTDSDNNVVSVEQNYQFQMPAENLALTANFYEEDIEPDLFTLTLIGNPENAGILTGDGEYEEGDEVLISAEPLEGYEFSYWTDIGNNLINENSEFYYTMPDKNVILVANFIEISDTYTLTLISDPDNSGILNGDGDYEEGENIFVSATANDGFEFTYWADINNNIISESSEFDFTMPGEDYTLVAYFNVINVIANINNEISVFPNPAKNKIYINSEINIDDIAIICISGKEAYRRKINNKSAKINISGITPGIYILKVFTQNEIIFKKITISN